MGKFFGLVKIDFGVNQLHSICTSCCLRFILCISLSKLVMTAPYYEYSGYYSSILTEIQHVTRIFEILIYLVKVHMWEFSQKTTQKRHF